MAQLFIAPLASALTPIFGATIAAGVAQVGVGLAISAVANAFTSSDTQNSGVRTQTTTFGDTTGQTFMLGHYATAGNYVAPRMAHTGGSGTPNAYRTLVIDLCDVVGAEFADILYVNEDRVAMTGTVHADYGATAFAGSEYEGKIWVKYYDGTQTAADPHLLSEYGSHAERPWTSTMIGEGICYAIVTLLYDQDVWGGREPSILFEKKGIPLYDISQDTTAGGSGPQRWDTPSTWVAGNSNPVVMIYNILRGIDLGNGRRFGGNADAEDLPAAEWIAAIQACNVLDESSNLDKISSDTHAAILQAALGDSYDSSLWVDSRVPLYSAGYEVRMGPDGDTPADIIDELLKACGGQIADLGGTVSIRVGDYPAATAFLTDDDIYVSQSQDMQPFTALEDSYNAVTGTYPSRQEAFQPKEAVPYRDLVAEAEDGRYLPASVQLNAIIWERQAQHLLRQWGLNARRMVRHTFSLPPRGLLINPLDVIDWTSDDYGYSGKDFEVSEIGIDPNSLSVTVSCREIDPTDVAWAPAFEAANFSPSSTIVYIDTQILPGWSVSEVSVLDDDGESRRVGILPSWNGDIPDALGVEVEIRLTSSGDLVYQGSTQNVSRGEKLITSGILPNTSYDVRGRLVANRATDWTSWTTVTTDNTLLSLADISASLGSNLLKNSTFANGSNHWRQLNDLGQVAFDETSLNIRQAGETWAGATFPTLMLFQDGSSTDGAVDVLSQSVGSSGAHSNLDIEIKPGDNVIASGYFSMHRCD